MANELWFNDDEHSLQITNATCYPPIGATVSTPWGTRRVVNLHFDYEEHTGNCRIHVELKKIWT